MAAGRRTRATALEETGLAADPLASFGLPTRTWFADVFAEPTAAQVGAWSAIASGQNALVIAPTGSGKTLAAFLYALDRLAAESTPARKGRCRVLYVSPLKALAVDVERNLRAPLAGIRQTAARLRAAVPEIEVGVRSGDTSAGDRRRLSTRPPDILITTPESLFLMLTSAAREVLGSVQTVIVDEVHALAGTKRGAHLAVSLERLDAQLPAPAQRIGLSATVRPPERVARFLGGQHPVTVVAPPAEKRWDLDIVVPIEDMSDLAGAAPPVALPTADSLDGLDPNGAPRRPSIWPHVESRILDLIESSHSTIVFANSRRLAERLTAHLNELHAERLGLPEGTDVAPPAQVMAQSGASRGQDGSAGPVVARAHHGSVSKEQRARIEDDLKAGVLPCVVATSSLELGIDMGAVDVVIQVESPPSVASGLQRVGRAGHHVGATSRGVFFPNHRSDLIESTVVVSRMREGAIEEVPALRNPLDVLAQQLVAIAASGAVTAEEMFALVRQAEPFAGLPRSAFEATLDMLSGRYPSEDFAELRPRLVWDRQSGSVSARPGAQRLAVTSGGTIPDRGLFGVFLVGEGSASGRHSPGRRVGELDEEMVYESRVGDVFTLGTTSWRIEDITHDQVLVSPAPGVPGRLPFWKGDAPGRPVELGEAFGRFVRELDAVGEPEALERVRKIGLDEFAARNLVSYLAEQRSATRVLPTDQTIVFERFRDELGDWRVCVYCPFGTGVLSPWALAIEHNARARYGTEVSATATNDGIVLRVPDTESEPPGADLVVCDVEDLERVVTDEVSGSALFASRFRECAARALLLPRRDPRARSPLWQQRMRSAQLLSVASRYPDFPIVLETMRECLTDVFDLTALVDLQERIAARSVRIVEVETREPSPFAKSLLFGYVGAFVYEGDVPLAEKRAAALSLDASLLSELLGRDGLRQLLDAGVIAETEADLQGRSVERRAVTVEQLFDLVRTAGPFTPAELAERGAPELDVIAAVTALRQARRLVELRVAGREMLAVTEDVPRLRDGVGVPVPPGIAAAFDAAPERPVEDLVLRWARTHGPFAPRDIADRYRLGVAVVKRVLDAMVVDGTVVFGAFTEVEPERQYCSTSVLALIKRRTLALLRKGVEPVDPQAFARFLPQWQGVGSGARGVDAVLSVVEQLAGYPVPASALESVVLPSRVADYSPALLDELVATGEVGWVGDGAVGTNDGWVRLYPGGAEPCPSGERPGGTAAALLLERLAGGGAYFFDALLPDRLRMSERADYVAALWELVWAGYVTPDSLAPLRNLVGTGAVRPMRRPQSRLRTARPRLTRPVAPTRVSTPSTVGRWALVARTDVPPASRLATDLFAQLDRYGVVTRGSVLTENTPGGFGTAYRALSSLEEAGHCRRGYFIAGLGAAQFALTGAVDRLRTELDRPSVTGSVVLAAADPGSPYGAALPWPEREGHRPGRKAGALVVLVDGALVFYVERGGRTLLSFSEDESLLKPAATALADAVSAGHLGKMTVERADGEHVFSSPSVSEALQAAGFRMTPQGLRLRPSAAP